MKPHYEPGRYLAKVIDQAVGKASTGTPQFIVKVTILGQVNPSEPDGDLIATAQYDRTIYRALTEKTMPYVMQDLEQLGFTGNSFRDLDPKTVGFCDFRGCEVYVFCDHKADQNGDPKEQWGIARQRSAPIEATPLDDKALRQLDNLFGKQLKAIKTSAPASKTKSAAATDPPPRPDADRPITDDDCPF